MTIADGYSTEIFSKVLKACSAKFHPSVQHFYFDSLESLPATLPTEEECQPLGSRYDGQIVVFGKNFQEKIMNHRQFLVGSGAIGCEMLKNWSMMGLGAGAKGIVHVTDLDTIEKSNLNRQFLFRPKDLGKFKSECAAGAVTEMNPDLKGKISTYQEAVGPATEGSSNRLDSPQVCLAEGMQDSTMRHSSAALRVSQTPWTTGKRVRF